MALADLPLADAGPVAVIVAPAADRETLARALRALLRHTGADVPLLVAGGRELLDELDAAGALERPVAALEATDVAGALAAAAAGTGRADLALVHPDTEVGPGWLTGLRDALRADTTLATATALANHAAFASVPRRNLPWTLLPPGVALDPAAQALRDRSPRVHPRIPVALAHATLLARPALDLVDVPAAAAPQAVLDAFSEAATAHGLRHVLADDVLVAHRGGAAAQEARTPALEAAIEDAANDRYGALGRAVLSAAAVIEERPSLTVDARCLGGGVSGSTVVVLELLAALHRAGARPRVVLADRPGEAADRLLHELPGLERLPASAVTEGLPRTAIVHRPWQVDTADDLRLLDLLGERLVISHHDLIAYRSPATFPDPGAWRDHRRVTQEALGLAATVLFLSEHARADALADDLLAPERALVVPAGVDPTVTTAAERRPAGVPAERPFLVCLGSRLRHKNLVFATALLEALRERGWDGDLVLAGRDVAHGSAGGALAVALAARPALAAHVVELADVAADEKAWLLAHAAGVVVPSTVEGFGLVPFEAAAAGTPPLVAPVASFAELLPPEATMLVPWDPQASADRVLPVLRDDAALVEAVRAAGAPHTWDRAAELTLGAYAHALALPAPRAARLAAQLGAAEHAYWSVRDRVGPAGFALVDPDDPLLGDDERATVVGALRDERTRGPLLRAARALARARRIARR